MTDFWIFFKLGFYHILDLHGYDHVLFIIVMMVSYIVKDWKRILMLITFFALAHSFSLLLASFNIIRVQVNIIEILIPITILITAFYNLLSAGKSSKNSSGVNFITIATLFFGVIHGFGFSNYFDKVSPEMPTDKLAPLLQFAIGIEAAQIVVVCAVLVFAFIIQTLLRFNRRDFILIMSSFVIGVVVPLILQSTIWKK